MINNIVVNFKFM